MSLEKILLEKIETWQKAAYPIVFTNGCFDLLHPGHLDYLSKAASLGKRLVIGLNDDDSVRRLKGLKRPINTLEDRKLMLESLRFVDLVIPFSEDTPINLIMDLKPNVLCKGGDYTMETIVGAEEVLRLGGQVKVIPFLEGYSSSQMIKKIVNQYL